MEFIQSTKDRLPILRKLVKNEPQLFAHLADCYLRLGRYKKATKELSRGLGQFPNHAEGWTVKGNLHLLFHQHKLALAAFKQVLKIDPDIGYAHEICAELAREDGDTERTVLHLRELKRIVPLEDSFQGRLQASLLGQVAIYHGLYTHEGMEDLSLNVLRQTLLEHNLIPEELARKHERFDYQEELEIPLDKVMADEAGVPEAVEEEGDASAKPEREDDLQPSPWAEEAVQKEERSTVEEETADRGEEEIEAESPEEEVPTHESPLMKMLRGEMEESPASREVSFVKETEESEPDEPDNLASQMLQSQDSIDLGGKSETDHELDQEEIRRREATEQRLAKIARDVTGAPEPALAETVMEEDVTEEPPPDETVPAEITPEEKPLEEVVSEETPALEPLPTETEPEEPPVAEPLPTVSLPEEEPLVEAQPEELDSVEPSPAEPIPEEAPSPEAEPEEPVTQEKEVSEIEETKPKTRVATKTLAELYASQGDLVNAIEVYEEMLAKHPKNEAYRMRIQSLRVEMESKS